MKWSEKVSKTLARNEMEGGCTGRHVNIQARLTEPQGSIKTTEQQNLNSVDIDLKSTSEIVRDFSRRRSESD